MFQLGISRVLYDIILYLGCWNAARIVHINFLNHVIHLPQEFFDTTPIGRILQRFSKDIDILDNYLSGLISDWVICLIEVIFSC